MGRGLTEVAALSELDDVVKLVLKLRALRVLLVLGAPLPLHFAANERNPPWAVVDSECTGLGISFARCEVRPPLRRRFPALGARPEGDCCDLRGWLRRSNDDAPINRSSALRIHPGAPCLEA